MKKETRDWLLGGGLTMPTYPILDIPLAHRDVLLLADMLDGWLSVSGYDGEDCTQQQELGRRLDEFLRNWPEEEE